MAYIAVSLSLLMSGSLFMKTLCHTNARSLRFTGILKNKSGKRLTLKKGLQMKHFQFQNVPGMLKRSG